ncbi:MAG: radical SAM protein [Alphaproteobacteria bacterium]
MPIIEPAIRPPSEAYSFLLQVTSSCSSNTCTFCRAYLDKPFKIKDEQEILGDIEEGAHYYPETNRVFLMDGDALILRNKKLLPILKKLDDAFPNLARISSYANGYNIAKRTDDELQELYDHKLRMIYVGLESGSQEILGVCKKKATVNEMVSAVQRVAKVGIKSSVMVLLGLGGKERTKQHISETIKALNEMQPLYLSFLAVVVTEGTGLYDQKKAGTFQTLTDREILFEMRGIIEGLNLKKTIFRSNHASNYLPLAGRFPNDKNRLLDEIDAALKGKRGLKPEWLRAL